jgi:negative regulator of flagellin synthesis FlgM
MKIGHLDHTPAASPVAGERKAAAAQQPAGSEPSAKVELSSTALLAGAGDDATFDQAKVDRISQAIQDGTFKINAEAIADKLIANAQELLGGGARR